MWLFMCALFLNLCGAQESIKGSIKQVNPASQQAAVVNGQVSLLFNL
jgi:hypothetical protein